MSRTYEEASRQIQVKISEVSEQSFDIVYQLILFEL